MNVGFQSNAFQQNAFATDAYVFPRPRFIAKQTAPAQFTVKEPDHNIMIAKRKEDTLTARRPLR